MSVGANKRVTPDTSPLEDAGGVGGPCEPSLLLPGVIFMVCVVAGVGAVRDTSPRMS